MSSGILKRKNSPRSRRLARAKKQRKKNETLYRNFFDFAVRNLQIGYTQLIAEWFYGITKARGAPGIGAEILFYREAVKKIGADSPVFLSAFGGQKKAL
jgi:hypothetical protein